MIPKIIHQTWKNSDIPETMKKFQKSWSIKNPGWQYCFYSDEECLEFVNHEYTDLTEVYACLEEDIQRIDFFRYLVVFKYGGIYADIDMECLKSLDDFLHEEILLSIETRITDTYRRQLGYSYPYQLANCIFAAEPKHWFIQKLIDKVVENSGKKVDCDNDVEDITGPRMLTRLFYSLSEKERDKIKVLSQIYWLPPTSFPDIWPVNKNMHARHHFLGTWKRNRTEKTSKQRRIEWSLPPYPWGTKYHSFYILK